MADYYADDSVLVKRHVQDRGTAWFQSIADPTTGNLIITSRLSVVEVYSALNRRRREASLDARDYADIRDDFTTIASTEYRLLEITAAVIEQARILLERYPLRASDAVQLASAVTVQSVLQTAGLAGITLLAADADLLAAARAEGFATEDANAYP